jgi:hypothetical protein
MLIRSWAKRHVEWGVEDDVAAEVEREVAIFEVQSWVKVSH